MLQTGLAVAFGFVAALFLVTLIAPAIARRVSELTWQQATRVLPQSSEEIAAGRDHLRGQNAIELRKLEMNLEAVAEKERLLRIAEHGYENKISALTSNGEALTAANLGLLTEKHRLTSELDQAAETNALLSTENADRDVRLAGLSSDFSQLRNDHLRLTAQLTSTEEARQLSEHKLELMRSEAANLRSKLSTSESELRIARTEGRRHESDLKLAGRKITALEAKLERNIQGLAVAEERLERREAELKRIKEQPKPLATVSPKVNHEVAPMNSLLNKPAESIETQIASLRPALRLAHRANVIEKARIKAEMLDLAGRVTAEAAQESASLTTEIKALKQGNGPLGDAILKHFHKAAE